MKGDLEMRRGWLILFWLLTIIIVSILLVFLGAKGKTSSTIQAIAIITLLFITWFYAKQTQRLVEQQKISLEEDRKKREADFGERIVKEYFMPMMTRCTRLEGTLKSITDLSKLNDSIAQVVDLINEMTPLIEKYGFLGPKKLGVYVGELTELLRVIVNIKHDEEEKFKKWKARAIVLVKEIHKIHIKQSQIYVKKIKKFYEREDSDENIPKEKRKIGGKMNIKRKIGILLILIGIGIPLVLFFFQEEGEIRLGRTIIKEVERNLTPEEIEFIKRQKELIEAKVKMTKKEIEDMDLYDRYTYSKLKGLIKDEDFIKKEKWTVRTEGKRLMPYKYTVGIGIIVILVGIGFFVFSFYSQESKKR